MARKPPGEARAQTRKARKASGNPRKAKASADLVASEAERVEEGLEGTYGSDVAPQRSNDASRRAGSAADPFGADQAIADASGADAQPESLDSEELGTRPNPSIRTEGQIKRAAKAQKKLEKDRRKRIARRVLIVMACLLVATLIALCIVFAIHRWNTFSDEEDFVGTWYVEGTDVPIVITADKIELTDGVAYSYELDPDSKTIEFKFGNMVGRGRYRFSLDRQQLAIMDGEYDYWGTLGDDAAWIIQAVIRDLQGLSMLSPGLEASAISEGTLVLMKQPNEEAADGLPDGQGGLLDAATGGDGSDADIAQGSEGDSTANEADANGADDASGANRGGAVAPGTQLDVKDL